MQQSSASSFVFFGSSDLCPWGILLLFFVVVSLKEQEGVEGSRSSTSKGARDEKLVFVQVYSSDRLPIFESDGPHLELKQVGNYSASGSAAATIDEGRSFATFFYRSPFAKDSELVVRGIKKGVPVKLFVVDQFGAVEKELPHGDSKVLYRFGMHE